MTGILMTLLQWQDFLKGATAVQSVKKVTTIKKGILPTTNVTSADIYMLTRRKMRNIAVVVAANLST